MRLGVFGLSAKATHGPAATARLARRAEALGYASWWVGDHVVVPSPRVPESPMAPTDAIVEPLVHLAFVAALTERIELGTGVVILPQRNPLVLAKQVAGLDVLSGGRVTLGVGAGWLEGEMTAVGVPMAERGSRTDEYLDAMRSLWLDEAPEFHGRHAEFARVEASPRPARPGGPRVVVGGHSPAAHRRAVARAHGWIGAMLAPAEVEQALAGLGAAADRVGRPADLGDLTVTVLAATPITPADARRYQALGVDELLVYPLPLESVDDVERALEAHAGLLG